MKVFVLQKKNRDINSAFTVRKISFGEGVERTFALHSSIIDSIKIIRSGKTRRAKLYYLRDRKGKSARIAEKITKRIGIDISENVSENQLVDKNVITENQTKTELKKETPNTAALKLETNKKEPKKENLKKKELKKEKK